jgi:hypothetical protein
MNELLDNAVFDVLDLIIWNNNNLLYDGDFIDRDDSLVSDDLILIWWDESGSK